MKLSEIKDNIKLVDEIEVKKYIPMAYKKMIIDGIKAQCIKQQEGMSNMYYIDFVTKEIVSVLLITQSYIKNVEFDEVEVENTLYDFYVSSGIWEKVEKEIPANEINLIESLVYDTIYTELEIENSIEGVLLRGLNKIADVINKNLNPKEINKFIKTFSKEIKDFDVDKLGVVAKLLDFNKKDES